MSFRQNIHLEDNIEERIEHFWDFKSADRLVENQKFVVMSIVCPNGTHQTAESFGIKVFGCFPSLDAANAYAKTLQEQCDAFDYFTIETQCWAKLPPQVEKIDDQNFLEGELEALKNTVIKNRKARTKMMEERMMSEKADNKKKIEADAEKEVDEAMAEGGVTMDV